MGAAAGAFATCMAGLVLFGIQMLVIQRPVLATFITPMDANMAEKYWNKLEPKALIFDPLVFRAPTVFGRFTVSSPSWYTQDPAWAALSASPNPTRMRAAGFSYVYFDRNFWDRLSGKEQSLFEASCVKQVAEVDGVRSPEDYSRDFRRLLDIENCK